MKFTAIVLTLIFLLIPTEARQQSCAVSPGTLAALDTPMTVSVEWLEKI